MKSRHRIFLSLFIFSSVFCALKAEAATLFVAAGAGGDCSQANPCGSVDQAIGQAQSGDTIQIGAGQFDLAAPLVVDGNTLNNLTLTGAGAGSTILDGKNVVQVLLILNSATVTVNTLTVQNGKYEDVDIPTLCGENPGGGEGGGGISIDAGCTVTLNQVTVRASSSTSGGGGICNAGNLTVNSSLIGGSSDADQNQAAFGGGILSSFSSTLVLDNSTVSHNLGTQTGDTGGGGGIGAAFATVTLQNNSIVSANRCIGFGGGIFQIQSNLTLNNSRILSNVADEDADGDGGGGGLFLIAIDDISATTTLINNQSLIDGNQADNGGGIFNLLGSLTVDNSTVSNNSAVGIDLGEGGGGIFNLFGNVVLQNGSTVDSNHAVVGDGGGIYSLGISSVGIDSVNAAVSRQQQGFSSSLVISQTTISNNTAGNDTSTDGQGLGGGIFGNEGISLLNVTLSGNSAAIAGGGFYNFITFSCETDCGQNFIHSTVANNSAPVGGGIVSDLDSSVTVNLKNTLLADNAGGNCAGDFFTTQKHNLSDDDSCTPALSDATDMNNTDPNIVPLADNGGVNTSHPKTHALIEPSPAIDAVDPTDCTDLDGNLLAVDERGFPRPGLGFGPNCDIGAFELQATPLITVSPPLLNYSTQVDEISAPQTVTITNVGKVPASLTGIALTGNDGALFNLVSNNCPASLDVGSNCTVAIVFSSANAGTFSNAALAVNSDAASNPDQVALSGTALAGTLTGGSSCFKSNLAAAEGSLSWQILGYLFGPTLLFGLKRRKE